MHSLKNHLNNRLRQLKTPTPTISIFRGKRWLASNTGAQGSRDEVYVQLDVAFRENQLAQLKGASLSVFLCIALHINEEGISYPSVKLICKETGYNRDTVHTALNKLQTMGYISRINKRRQKGSQQYRSNSYRIFPQSWQRKPEKP